MTPRSPTPARSCSLSRAPIATILSATALAGAVALSGCQMMSPMQTAQPYQPADGVAVDLGDIHIRSLLVVTSAKGDAGALSGLVVNAGSQPVKITFAAGAGNTATLEVAAGKQAQLAGVEGVAPVTLARTAVAPGGIITLIVSTPDGGSPQVAVPVMLPAGIYATITPAPTATATATS